LVSYCSHISTSILIETFGHRIQANLDLASSEVLRQYFTTLATENDEQGWEERIGAAMTYLLRTTLAKNAREASVQQVEMVMPEDTKKTRKHIKVVCERVGKGTALTKEGRLTRVHSSNEHAPETPGIPNPRLQV
jgi:hypothetical protein